MTTVCYVTSPLPILKPTFKPNSKEVREMKIKQIAGDKSRGIPPSFLCTECVRNSDGQVVDVECHCSSSEQEAIRMCCKKAIAARKEIK